jgi:xanthine/uracil permease
MSESINAETQQEIEFEERPLSTPVFRHVARVMLATFLLTFIASRVMVILIMDQKVPDFFFHVGKTHVHHLNYGIFILSGVGAYLIFRRPSGRHLTWATIAYGIGLGLTFDEFGMWVHLGGSYWQRASFDAVVIIASALGLIAYAPSISRFKTQHWVWTLFLTAVVTTSIVLLGISLSDHYTKKLAPWLQQIESTGPQ